MKTIVRLFIAAVIVLGAQSSHATNPHPSVIIRVLDPTSFALSMKEIDNQKIKITLVDEEGHILYYQPLRNKSSFERRLNLRELAVGKYSLEIKDEIGTLSYPIKLIDNELMISVDERVVTFSPIIRKTNETISLVLFSPARHSHKLSIYNGQDELVYGENIEATVNYAKQFNFSQAIPGSYSIVINSRGHKYTYLVPVK